MGKERLQCIVSTSGQMMTWNAERKKRDYRGGKLLPQQRQELSSIVQPHTKKPNQSFLGEPLVFSVVFGDKLTEPETLQCVKSM